jgi:hypothetical protein
VLCIKLGTKLLVNYVLSIRLKSLPLSEGSVRSRSRTSTTHDTASVTTSHIERKTLRSCGISACRMREKSVERICVHRSWSAAGAMEDPKREWVFPVPTCPMAIIEELKPGRRVSVSICALY